MSRGLVTGLLVWIASVAHGGILPDDHADTLSGATPLAGASNAITGLLEFDTDHDVFSFPFLPGRSYVIQVRTGTVWDVALAITPPGAAAPLLATNTAWFSPLNMNWTSTAAASRWYLDVSALVDYTTGTYHLSVWEAPFTQDADGDGMADAWELAQFGSTTNQPGDDYDGDGSSNLNEYLAQTPGGSASGGIDIDRLVKLTGKDIVTWNQSAYATYDLDTSTNVFGPWQFLGTRVGGATSATIQWTNDPAVNPVQFYRLRFRY